MNAPETIVSQLLEADDLSGYGEVAIASDMRAWATTNNGHWLEWVREIRPEVFLCICYYLFTKQITINVTAPECINNFFVYTLPRRGKEYAEVSTKLYELSHTILKLGQLQPNEPFSSPILLNQIKKILRRDPVLGPVQDDQPQYQ